MKIFQNSDMSSKKIPNIQDVQEASEKFKAHLLSKGIVVGKIIAKGTDGLVHFATCGSDKLVVKFITGPSARRKQFKEYLARQRIPELSPPIVYTTFIDSTAIICMKYIEGKLLKYYVDKHQPLLIALQKKLKEAYEHSLRLGICMTSQHDLNIIITDDLNVSFIDFSRCFIGNTPFPGSFEERTLSFHDSKPRSAFGVYPDILRDFFREQDSRGILERSYISEDFQSKHIFWTNEFRAHNNLGSFVPLPNSKMHEILNRYLVMRRRAKQKAYRYTYLAKFKANQSVRGVRKSLRRSLTPANL